jgi:hypothetical protein
MLETLASSFLWCKRSVSISLRHLSQEQALRFHGK